MPSVEYTLPKDWVNTERVTAENLNEQLRDNITWLFEKNLVVAQRSGVTNETTTVTTAPTTSVFVEIFDLSIDKSLEDSALRIELSASIAISSAGARLRFDVIIDNSYFLSSGTSTPNSDGVAYHEFPAANRDFPMAFGRFLDNVAAGSHRVQLVWWVSAGTGTVNITNTVAQFSVEEYGVPDFQ